MPDLPSQEHADQQQIRLILAALQDGVILIEPDQRISWANKAALRMHGVHEVAELGATVSEYRGRFELRYRNRHRLPEGAYPMERVMAGEAFDEVVVEVAPAGENETLWTHRIRSLVLNDPAGVPNCLVLILNDETERFDAEERFEAAFSANPAPAVILRLSDHRHIKVNRGFLEMTGYAEEQVVGRSAYEIDVLEGAARREFAVERLQQGRTIPQMEALLQLPGGGEKRVVVAGQPIEVGGTDCMLFTFVDIEPHKRAEEALRRSENSFDVAFRLSPAPTFLALRAGCRLLQANTAFVRESGYPEAELVGKWTGELGLWADPAAGRELERRLEVDGAVRDFALQLRTRAGDLLDVLLSAEAVSMGEGSCVLVVAQNVAEHRRTEMEIASAIEAVLRDTSWFSRMVLEKLAKLRRPDALDGTMTAELADLPPRGRDVLALVCRGMADPSIAHKLGISRNTVRNHITALYRRTGVRTRAALVVWARERGFTGGPPPKVPGPTKD
ncbi:helix-turn-helix transcriptional regulator [Roseomonas nepalensis]|uniref:Helix-turn-helix transcriptional regulator n=1 Tax=Muricoccus nepalensis TaxID=1854500 RepID=A0A502FSJ8_9PROT|nr:PAS domain S-box protein [Roseomonas nepalensis]TPG52498.1 helix-turn-helix transcriptional regulator [Roseomonas nepalensis]